MTVNRFIQTSLMALALTAGGTALAQSDHPNAPPKDRTVGKEQKGQAQQAPKMRRVSEITGKLTAGTNVIGSDNEKLGDIDHLAIDLNSGKAHFAVISSGGVAGVGGTWRAVPLKALKFSELNEPARLNMAKTEFEAAPTIDKDSWNRMNDTEWRTTTYRYYKIDVDRDGDRDVKIERETKTTVKPAGSNLVRSDKVIGMDVQNTQNEDLGDVNDLVVDLNSCRIAYTVLGFGGFLGMGEKLFAVPFQALNLDQADNHFVLNIDKDRLRDAPGFDRDKWPDMADARWAQNVHAFYGTQPDVVYGYVGEGNTQTGNARSRGWEHEGEYNKMFKASAIETFTGSITGVNRTAPMSNMSEGVILNLKTNDGQTLPVHLGPAWFIDHQDIRFNNGDQVTVTGCRSDIQGKPAVIATEVRASNAVMTLRQKDGMPAWDATRPASGRDVPRDRNNRDSRDRDATRP